MNIPSATRVFRATLVLSWGVISYLAGLLAEASRGSQEDTEDYLIGEYNYRTHKLDAGADPNGWYEEDM